MFKIGNVEIKNNVVIAPMAGYTNSVYRKIMVESGAGLVYSEMISAKGLLYENDKTWELTKVDSKEHPIAIQLFGGEVDDLVKAAIMIDNNTACDIIDINMGCPVKKVLKSDSGSKLLTDPDKIYDIVKAVVSNVKKPVSVKIRAGWDHNSINAVEVAKKIEAAGASMIAIHGRTKSDLYRGKVNLDFIKMVKDSVSIPVIGNGDIKTIEDMNKMIEYTNVDAVMIGRGSLGNPWLIESLIKGENIMPSPIEKIKMCRFHFMELSKLKGEKIAVLEMRTLVPWYLKGINNLREFKVELVNITKESEMLDLFNRIEEKIS